MINIVTTFSKSGYDLYGRGFLDGFLKYWPKDINLYLFLDPPLTSYDIVPISNIVVKDLSAESNIHGFMSDFGWMRNMSDPRNYRFQGSRFSHKIFALTAPCLPRSGIRIWLDADTVTFTPIDPDYLRECLPRSGEMLSYLGRKDWDHSECGWVGYDLACGGLGFLKEFLEIYETGAVVSYAQTHDSFVFDRLREKFQAKGSRFRNLSQDCRGLNAWRQSVLGERMVHNKGNEKFR